MMERNTVMFKRILSLFSIATIAAIVLAACGVSTTPQSSGSAAPTSAPAAASGGATAAPAASGNMVTIKWRTRPSDAAEQSVYEALNEAANQQLASKNIKAVYDPGVNQDYEPKLKAELAAGTAPDIAWIPGASVADYAAAGQVLDIKPFIDKDSNFKLDNFYPQPVAELSHDGKVYGLPRDISTMVTYYNEDLFKAAGIPTPKELSDQGKWNWDTMLESAKKLTDAGKQQYGLGFGNWWGPAWGYFTNAAGGGMFNKDRTGCGLDSAESVAGAKYAQELYNQKLVVAGDQDSEALFSAGKVGMYFNGRWFTPGVRTNAKFAWDVAEMPQGKVKSTWLFWGPYIINSKTANPDAAWEVMKAITAPEAMAKVAEMGTNIPSRKDQSAVDAFLKSSPPANNQAFIKGTDYAVAEQALYTGNWGDFSSKVQALWDQMIAGQITPEDFGKQACEQTAGTFKK
jgi:multiple sugar transport system substrate-binding protein